MASEKAKQLAREQKAARKAEKLRKKNSTNPADWGTIRQFREVFKYTKESDPALPWKLAGAFAATLVVFIVIGLFIKPLIMWIITGILAGFAVAMLLFSRYAKQGAYKRYRDQPGSAEVAFADLPKKAWNITPAYTGTRQGEVVHRLVGRPGIVLVGEGEPGRLHKLLESEVKRHEQVAYGVEVTVIEMGDRPGQVKLEKLAKAIRKLPKRIDAVQVEETVSRLKALDNMRGKVPIPKGPLPNRVSRKAMRGR